MSKYSIPSLRSQPDFNFKVDKTSKERWNSQLQLFQDAYLTQTWDWGEITCGAKSVSRLTLEYKGNTIGMVQTRIRQLPFTTLGMGTAYGGPIWIRNYDQRNIDNLKYLLTAMYEEYVVRRGLVLIITPNIFSIQGDDITTTFEEAGFRLCSTNKVYRTSRLDLTLSVEDLYKNLSRNWKRHLNRANASGVTVKTKNDLEYFKIFRKLYEEMLTRKQFDTSINISNYELLQELLHDSLKLKIMIAYLNDKPAYGAVFSTFGGTGVYLLGATSNYGLQTKASYLVHWNFVLWLKENGYRWYDLGGISPEHNPGVYQFKHGMRGEDCSWVGQFGASNNFLGRNMIKLAYQLRRVIS